jgi:hypothetical protein
MLIKQDLESIEKLLDKKFSRQEEKFDLKYLNLEKRVSNIENHISPN